MTSKRKLRAEIARLHGEAGSEWLRGFKAACGRTIDPADWAAHLARVTDAALEQGRQEGFAALAAEVSALHRRNDDSPWCDHGVGGWPCPTALLVARMASDPQPQPETTPDPAGGCQADVRPDGPCCGFACCCTHTPETWTPGSVTR